MDSGEYRKLAKKPIAAPASVIKINEIVESRVFALTRNMIATKGMINVIATNTYVEGKIRS